MARFLTGNEADLEEAARLLKQGKLVAIPTETVYGLAANAFDELAVARTFKAKERPTFDPLIVHVAESWAKGKNPLERLEEHQLIDLSKLSEVVQKRATTLIRKFWPGPLTLLLPKHPRVPDLVTSGLPQVGLRCPAHPLTQALLEKVNLPLSAPSANRFGRISPTEALHVEEELGTKIDAILDGGPATIGVESTVLDVATLTLLRPGGLPREEIETVLGEKLLLPAAGAAKGAQLSPGLLESHYAPKKTVYLLPDLAKIPESKRGQSFALLTWDEKIPKLPATFPKPSLTCALTDPHTDSKQDDRTLGAAKNLFKTLRELDHDPAIQWILVEPCTVQTGLGPAIQDRLRRAATSLSKSS